MDFDSSQSFSASKLIIHESPVSLISHDVPSDCGTQPRAVKSATIRRKFSKEPHDIIKEVRLIPALSHPNIIGFFDQKLDQTTSTLSFWMPYEPLSLAGLLVSPQFSPFLEDGSTPALHQSRFLLLAKSIIFQIISALAYLHNPSQSIAHRDVKPGNILLSSSGCVKLIDFGIAWKATEEPSTQKDDLWPEASDRMYNQVSTGPYRAPELLFGPSSYDAFAIDIWSLGATFADFFTALRFRHESYDSDSDSEDEDQELRHHILPRRQRGFTDRTYWDRDTLFDADRGEIGLVWSIFKVRGTPTDEIWPTFNDLPDASKVTFETVLPEHLSLLLPNLPSSCVLPGFNNTSPPPHFPPSDMSPSPLDLLYRFLIYPPSRRLPAAEAIKHPWFTVSPPVLLPIDYPEAQNLATWEGKSLDEWLQQVLSGSQRQIPQ